ncbi:oligogalacturonate lyase family protein [Viridibacterium curvum]|uniref:Oligogalacturonate lyase n=1 Tax=Viridibacterium curvum TaxID=1101404 RepID=A0ABP9R5W7_9RHOO
MAKGSTRTLRSHEFRDPDTGVRITRLTPPEVVCHRTYFYQKCFTSDGRYLLFGGGFDGHWNCWLLDLVTAQATQLTEGAGDNAFGAFITPDEQAVCYVKGNSVLYRVDLATLQEDPVFLVPEGWKGAGTWVPNSAGTHLAAMLLAREDIAAGKGWEQFHRQLARNPRCQLLSVDMQTGAARVVLDQRRWMGHPMYRPFDDETMAFCHEGPHDLVDARMWLVNSDGSKLRCVKKQDAGESCMHEFWVPDGSRMMYVSYRHGEQQRWICEADPVTLENRRLMAMPPCSHIMSNHDGSLLVGDGAGHLDDIADKAAFQFEPDPWLYLFQPERQRVTRIAAHRTSWREIRGNHQVTHPHPSFTPDERRVLYTSDFEGEPALYLADVPPDS